jgi:hypothetical protein
MTLKARKMVDLELICGGWDLVHPRQNLFSGILGEKVGKTPPITGQIFELFLRQLSDYYFLIRCRI